MLFRNRVMVNIRVMDGIRLSVWLVSCYAQAFVLSIVVLTLTIKHFTNIMYFFLRRPAQAAVYQHRIDSVQATGRDCSRNPSRVSHRPSLLCCILSPPTTDNSRHFYSTKADQTYLAAAARQLIIP